MQTVITPDNYKIYEEQTKSGRQVPATLSVWIAQQEIEGTPSVVTAPYSFKNGGDCEALVIATNTSKGMDSPVVWRREHLMAWGFYGTPNQYTEDGRKLFVNCLSYMAGRAKFKW